MLLGLDAERPFKVCSTIKKVAIKDTSITDTGAFNLMIHCDKLESLELSQDNFLPQLLWRISENYLRTKTVFNLKTLYLRVNKPCMMTSVVKSLPKLEELASWTTLENTSDLKRDNLKNIKRLKLGGLNHSSFSKQICSLLGSQLTYLKIETVHFEVDISLIGIECPKVEELNIINARVKDAKHDDHSELFSRLKLLYFFLVQYTIDPVHNYRPPSSPSATTGVPSPSTGHTALHTIMQKATNLESIQVSGCPTLTDSCMDKILTQNPLSKLKRLVISHPLSKDHTLVPLTSKSVIKLQSSCPGILWLGDLRHWAVSQPGAEEETGQGGEDSTGVALAMLAVW